MGYGPAEDRSIEKLGSVREAWGRAGVGVGWGDWQGLQRREVPKVGSEGGPPAGWHVKLYVAAQHQIF